MRSREKRMKASDVFPTLLLFEKEFPQLVDFRIRVEEKRGYSDYSKSPRVHIFTPANPPGEYVDCSNPYCYNGGFSIRAILRDMVKKGETERETSEVCQGYLGSPKGRKKIKPCFNSFEVSIQLKYENS